MHTSQKQQEPGARPHGDHVARLVERCFGMHDAELHVGGISVSQLAAKFGIPLFVYDQGVVLRKIDEVRSMLPSHFGLFYSIKNSC